MCANGSAQNVVSAMTGISTPQEIFWPRGSRHRPVEGVSDLLGQKLKQATPSEAGKPVREDGKPLALDLGWMSLGSQYTPNCLCDGLCLWHQVSELVNGQGLGAIFEGFIGIRMDLDE